MFTTKVARTAQAARKAVTSSILKNRTYAVPTTTTDMFCFQCEQTKDHKGCTTVGNCGKTPEVAALQDLLIHALKAMSIYAHHARSRLGKALPEGIDEFTVTSTFSTLTNVNFDPERMHQYLLQADQYKKQCEALCGDEIPPEVNFSAKHSGTHLWQVTPGQTVEQLIEFGKAFGIQARSQKMNEDILGLQEMIIYGLKGLAAYGEHAFVLGQKDPEVFKFVHECLAFMVSEDSQDVGKLVEMAMKVGKVNYRVLELLDLGGNTKFGTPSPTKVRITNVPGKCILVSGHDILDLENILKQTEGKGINVYTHGELLPAHAYPEIRKYKHLVGNYGGAWQLQKMEFSAFPGPIVMTTNCLIEPRNSYKNRLFTRGAVGWPGIPHITDGDYSAVIDSALKCEGFTEEDCKSEKFILTGFGHKTVLGVADKVVDAVQKGAIKRFFVIGGCDGAEAERNYYKKFADNLPKEAVILTLGCGKYRFNKQDFGNVPGTELPRLLDMGQCNDSYSAVQVALALAQVFKTDVNGLPLNLVISWFEQKAVAVLLTLLSLGVKNIHIGPSLPAFATPNILALLQKEFNLTPIGDPKEDLKRMTAGTM